LTPKAKDAAVTQSTDPKPPSVPAWARKVIPALVSVLIIYYYFRGQDWQELINAARRADLLIAVLALAIPQVIFWFADAYLTQRHMEWFHGPFSLREYFWTRGAMYILLMVNPTIGGGGILFYLQRKAGISWRKLIGIMLFRGGLTGWGLAIVMIPFTLALYYYGLTEKVRLNLWVWWGMLIFGAYWLFEGWMVWHYNMHFGLSRIILKDRTTEFWHALYTATKKQWWITWVLALLPFFLMMIGFYFLTRAFGVEVPFWTFMAVAPIAVAIMDLPIAFAGFGTTTVAWQLFFKDYGADENILALTLFLPFARSVIRALIGAVSLWPAMKDINALFQEDKTEAEQDEEDRL
jgi:uncharacterized membrane protein YbhN (UPF0104 family)